MRRQSEATSAEWESIDPFHGTGVSPAFVSGDTDGDRLRVSYFRRPSDEQVRAKVWFGAKAEGPPHHAHGGSIAAVLDEAMSVAAWIIGEKVVAVRLTVNFRRALPLGTDATVEVRITRREGKKVWIRGRLMDSDRNVFADGRGLFVSLQMGRFTERAV